MARTLSTRGIPGLGNVANILALLVNDGTVDAAYNENSSISRIRTRPPVAEAISGSGLPFRVMPFLRSDRPGATIDGDRHSVMKLLNLNAVLSPANINKVINPIGLRGHTLINFGVLIAGNRAL